MGGLPVRLLGLQERPQGPGDRGLPLRRRERPDRRDLEAGETGRVGAHGRTARRPRVLGRRADVARSAKRGPREAFRDLFLDTVTHDADELDLLVARAGTDRVKAFMAEHAETGFASLEEAGDAVDAYQPHRKRPRNLDGLVKNVRRGEDGRFYWHWDPRRMQRQWNMDEYRDRLERAAGNLGVNLGELRSERSPVYLPSQIVPLLFVTGTPTAFPYSVHDPS